MHGTHFETLELFWMEGPSTLECRLIICIEMHHRDLLPTPTPPGFLQTMNHHRIPADSLVRSR
jgi:hypothetical protein